MKDSFIRAFQKILLVVSLVVILQPPLHNVWKSQIFLLALLVIFSTKEFKKLLVGSSVVLTVLTVILTQMHPPSLPIGHQSI